MKNGYKLSELKVGKSEDVFGAVYTLEYVDGLVYKKPGLLSSPVDDWCGFGSGESTKDYCGQGVSD